MEPQISDGDFVIICTWFSYFPMIKNAVYEIAHPLYGDIIKAFLKKEGDGLYFYGFSERSVSSKQLGKVSKKSVLGKVVWVIKSKH